MTAYKAEITYYKRAALPFLSFVTIVSANENGLYWGLESRLFGYAIHKAPHIQCGWDKIEKVQLETSGERIRLRIIPKDRNLFARPITGFYGGRALKLKIGADGGIYLTEGDYARQLFQACKKYVSGEETDGPPIN